MSDLQDINSDSGCLSFNGDLTIYEANAASEKLCKAFGSGALKQIDLAGVTELDTAGLQILLLARTLRTPSDEPVSLINHSEAVREVFGLAGLETRQ